MAEPFDLDAHQNQKYGFSIKLKWHTKEIMLNGLKGCHIQLAQIGFQIEFIKKKRNFFFWSVENNNVNPAIETFKHLKSHPILTYGYVL